MTGRHRGLTKSCSARWWSSREISQGDSEQVELYAKRRRGYVEEALIQRACSTKRQLLKFQAAVQDVLRFDEEARDRANRRLVAQAHHAQARCEALHLSGEVRAAQGELSILTVEPDDLDMLKSVQFATRVLEGARARCAARCDPSRDQGALPNEAHRVRQVRRGAHARTAGSWRDRARRAKQTLRSTAMSRRRAS